MPDNDDAARVIIRLPVGITGCLVVSDGHGMYLAASGKPPLLLGKGSIQLTVVDKYWLAVAGLFEGNGDWLPRDLCSAGHRIAQVTRSDQGAWAAAFKREQLEDELSLIEVEAGGGRERTTSVWRRAASRGEGWTWYAKE